MTEDEWLASYFMFGREEIAKLPTPARMELKSLIGELQHYRDQFAAEERRAWDGYVAFRRIGHVDDAAMVADEMLAARRKRFPVKL